MSAPPFPTQSAAGAFPSFPVSYVSVPNIINLPGWVFSEITYYGNPLNYPYSSPPALSTWSIPYPDLLKIPSFLLNLLIWLIGWAGALFEWVFAYASWGLSYIVGTLLNWSFDLLNNITNLANQAAGATGIFAPLIEALFIAGLALAFIGIAFVVVNAIKMVIP